VRIVQKGVHPDVSMECVCQMENALMDVKVTCTLVTPAVRRPTQIAPHTWILSLD